MSLWGLVGGYWTEALTRWREEYSAGVGQSVLGRAALDVATAEIGCGELGGNNRGPDVRRYRGDDRAAAWCAAFLCWCFEQGAAALELEVPWSRTHGAKALYRRIGKAGAFVDRPLPGDVACWHRGARGSWMGHVGIVSWVEGNVFACVEGNRGRYPSKVRIYEHELGEAQLIGFVRAP